MVERDKLGARLAPKLARHIADAVVHVNRQLADHKADVGMTAATRFADLLGAELRPMLSPVLVALRDHPDTPDELRPMLSFLAEHPGEAAGIAMTALGVSGFSSSIASVISDWTATAVQDVIRAHPNALLNPETAARLTTMGVLSEAQGAYEASGQGIERSRFDALLQAAHVWLDLAQVYDARNRGIIDDAGMGQALKLLGYRPDEAAVAARLRQQLPQVADVALGLLRGNIDEATATRKAAEVGWGAADLALIAANTGEPIAVEQALELFRRGKIDDARLARAVRQSRVRNEWLDAVRELRFAPPDAGIVLAGAVQGHLSDAEARRKVEEAGTDPANYEWLYETHGNPPGTGELLQLLRRGDTTPAVVEQAIRESRVKNKYIPELMKLRRRLPPERTVVAMIGRGVLTEAQGLGLLRDLGFDPTISAALAKEAHSTKTAAHKQLAEGTVRALYADRHITRGEAETFLADLHYDRVESDLILDLVDVTRTLRVHDAAVANLRGRYVGWRVDEPAVRRDLGRLGVDPAQVEEYLTVWTLERETHRPRLTEAQVIKAHKRGVFTDAQALAALADIGYGDAVSLVLLEES